MRPRTRPLLASFDHQDVVVDAVFSPDGARILTASRDKTAKLWDAASGKLIGSFAHQDWIEHGAFKSGRHSDPDGERGQNRQASGCVLGQADRLF